MMTSSINFNVIIWIMEHFDYLAGQITWENTPTEKAPYTCLDKDGNLIEVTIKRPETHDSWVNIQSEPAYHYNLGFIIANPHQVRESTSQQPSAIVHREQGKVVTYVRYGFVSSLNMPSSWQFPTDMTTVTVKYTGTKNYTLTSQIFRNF